MLLWILQQFRSELNLRPYLACAALLVVAVLLLGGATAAPYVPKSDAQVVEQLPLKANDPIARELRDLRQALAGDAQNPDLAVRLARRYFDLAMAEGDPRYVGYAEAAIRPWTAESEPPLQVVYMRALVRQYRHEFAPAIADLEAVLKRDPAHSNALSWRMALHLVLGDYAQARKVCERTNAAESRLSAVACVAVIDGINGKARAAYAALSTALARESLKDPDRRQWMLTRLAEMALRFGDDRLAERHFREAMAASGPDGFVLAAYADFLLDRKRPAEVVGLLKEWTRSDILLLRLALAETELGAPAAREHATALADRFAAAALRGDRLHLQEEARFELSLRNDPTAALKLAAENWSIQREPRDARVLMEAAVAARRPDAAQPALDWLRATGYEDPRYRALGDALAGPAK
jgi:Tfp pilus assembly protein PilF